MENFISIVFDSKPDKDFSKTFLACFDNISESLMEEETDYVVFEATGGKTVYRIGIKESPSDADAEKLADHLYTHLYVQGYDNFDIEITADELSESIEDLEETYDGDDFYEAYGDLWFNEDETLDEAEYQGRKVKLGKPMRGDVKKFKVYVKNPKGNVVKVNFGDPNMKIKKSNPARRRSFRARHNCDNPGPRHKARYWSCRKW